jgi:hypothetical protein
MVPYRQESAIQPESKSAFTWKDATVGLLGGLSAALVVTGFRTGWSELQRRRKVGSKPPPGEAATTKAAGVVAVNTRSPG